VSGRDGGGGEWFRSKIEAYVKRFGLPYPTKSVKVAFASLGSDAGFIGTAGCARLLVRRSSHSGVRHAGDAMAAWDEFDRPGAERSADG